MGECLEEAVRNLNAGEFTTSKPMKSSWRSYDEVMSTARSQRPDQSILPRTSRVTQCTCSCVHHPAQLVHAHCNQNCLPLTISLNSHLPLNFVAHPVIPKLISFLESTRCSQPLLLHPNVISISRTLLVFPSFMFFEENVFC